VSHQTDIAAHVSYLEPRHFQSTPLIDLPPGTSPVTPGAIARHSFMGPFITQDEVEALATLRTLVEGQVREGPNSVRTTLQRRTRVRNLSVQLRTEPLVEDHMHRRDGLIILLGSGKYNARSQEVLESSASFFRFEYDDRPEFGHGRTFYVNPDRTGQNRDYIRENGRHPDPALSSELAVIQRIYEPETRSTILMCCGLSAPASHAAVVYLTQSWQELAARYPDARESDFGILLRLPDQDRDSLLDRGGRVQLVRRVHGPPIPRSRVHKVIGPEATPRATTVDVRRDHESQSPT
jgi:hypothetical protein